MIIIWSLIFSLSLKHRSNQFNKNIVACISYSNFRNFAMRLGTWFLFSLGGKFYPCFAHSHTSKKRVILTEPANNLMIGVLNFDMRAILHSCDVFSFSCLEGADHQRCEALKGGGRCAEAGWRSLHPWWPAPGGSSVSLQAPYNTHVQFVYLCTLDKEILRERNG